MLGDTLGRSSSFWTEKTSRISVGLGQMESGVREWEDERETAFGMQNKWMNLINIKQPINHSLFCFKLLVASV